MRRRLGWAAVTVGVLVLVASLVVRLPYYVLSPGMSRPTEGLITVQGAETFANDGAVDFLTVSMRQVTPIEVVASWINGAQQIRSADEILGRLSPGESRELDLRMMAGSKDAAQYQALRRLGYDIGRHGTGAVIASVVAGGPVDGVLVAGDVVTAIDGRAIELSDELITVVGASPPGTVLTLDVQPIDESRDGARPARRVEVAVGIRVERALECAPVDGQRRERVRFRRQRCHEHPHQTVSIDPTLIIAVMAVESGFNPFAQSPMGAQGLMQVMTGVHVDKYASFGGKLAAFDPLTNLRVGARVLHECIARAGSTEGGLRLYVGAGNREDDGGYVAKVLGEHQRLAQVAQGKPVPTAQPAATPGSPAAPADAEKVAVALSAR